MNLFELYNVLKDGQKGRNNFLVTVVQGLSLIHICIGGNAFFGCSSLENVFIPDSVKYCGRCAFNGCTSLKSISAPETMTTNEDTFYGCNATITWRTVASVSYTHLDVYKRQV